ncbi:unnamed protein product [Moneuplotes crassus]|uniref:non-specific serine/threonine protein kinase n=1 Tax=Euplotes crassus TaxID=5936 RepID=A0AAD1U1K5_EUPCR|nr:unnamed protein product [Moneuplotes crassus]
MFLSLGDGAYSQVFKVRRSSDMDYYALKLIKLGKLSEKEVLNSLNEVRILASISNKNVISYKEAFYDTEKEALCIIMEYANDKDLYQ